MRKVFAGKNLIYRKGKKVKINSLGKANQNTTTVNMHAHLLAFASMYAPGYRWTTLMQAAAHCNNHKHHFEEQTNNRKTERKRV